MEGSPETGGPGCRELRIEALTAGGRGLARPEGPVWFVSGAVPGDRVLARGRRFHGRFVEATVERRVESSALRREPACPIQERCGGCPWMVLDESLQREWKVRLLQEALGRIGGLPTIPMESVKFGRQSLAYRNKVEFAVGLDGSGRPVVGLHSAGQETLVDVERCAVQSELGNRLLATCREFLLAGGDGDDLRAGFRLVLRTSQTTGEALVALRETAVPFPRAAELAARLMERHPEVRGVVRILSRSGQRGGSRSIVVAGNNWIAEQLGGVVYRLPAASFLQVNAELAAEMIGLVAECAGEVRRARVFDLYGGVGAYGAELARRGATATICDADVEAIRCGKQAARRAGLERVQFVHADVRRFLRRGLEQGLRADVILANPPRAGLGPGVAAGVVDYRPRRVVLISCDPATLARDVKTFCANGYRLTRVIPIDLFPQTSQVEVIALLVREVG